MFIVILHLLIYVSIYLFPLVSVLFCLEQQLKLKGVHLRTLLDDAQRNEVMMMKTNDIVLDYSREKVDQKAMQDLYALAEKSGVEEQRRKMFSGELAVQSYGQHLTLTPFRRHNY